MIDCQDCAACCKQFWIYVYNRDKAKRFADLNTNLISVKKIKDGVWKVIFNFECSKLDIKDGKYVCKIYKGDRPGFCREYPDNFRDEDTDVLAEERKVCPKLR